MQVPPTPTTLEQYPKTPDAFQQVACPTALVGVAAKDVAVAAFPVMLKAPVPVMFVTAIAGAESATPESWQFP